jgi:hypothetical protein
MPQTRPDLSMAFMEGPPNLSLMILKLQLGPTECLQDADKAKPRKWRFPPTCSGGYFICPRLNWVQFPEFALCLQQYRQVGIRVRP